MLKTYFKYINLKSVILVILLSICVQFFATSIVELVLSFMPVTSLEYAETIGKLTELTPMVIIYVCIVAPLFEEIFFRGICMQLAQLKLPFIAADIIQAVLFSVYHDNAVQKVYALIIGLFIGFIVFRLKNIFYGIIFHIAMNTLGVIEENYFGAINGTMIMHIISAVSFICFIIICWYMFIRPLEAKNTAGNI